MVENPGNMAAKSLDCYDEYATQKIAEHTEYFLFLGHWIFLVGYWIFSFVLVPSFETPLVLRGQQASCFL